LRKRVQIITNDGEIITEKNMSYTNVMGEDGYRIPYHKSGARTFADISFPKSMSDAEIGKMTRLANLMIGKTNMLGYRKGRGIEAYTENEIINIVGLQHRQGRQFLRKMYDLRIMRKTEVGIYINPKYFMTAGQRLTLDLFLIFREDLKGFLPDWVLSEFIRQASIKAEVKKNERL